MSQAIGWWEYDETDRPTLINRFSGERVRLGGEVDVPGKPPGQRWVRLDYLHDDLEFPVLACWEVERGYIVVDYLVSSELWRRETNAARHDPPYGSWVRVDDCIVDALLCWPENLRKLFLDRRVRTQGLIAASGGWSNGIWRRDLLRICHLPHVGDDRIEPDAGIAGALSNSLTRPNAAPPAPWFFVDATSLSDHRERGYSRYGNIELVPSRPSEPFVRKSNHELPKGYASVSINGVVPHMRSTNGSRILFPYAAHLHCAHPGRHPASGSISCMYLERHLAGINAGWSRGYDSLHYSRDDLDSVRAAFGDAGDKPFVRPDSRSSSAERVRWEMPVYRRERNRAACRHVSPGGGEESKPVVNAWILTAWARRTLTRSIQDALLFWEGTENRPGSWENTSSDLLSYRQPDSVTVSTKLLGGGTKGFEITARLGDDRPWTWDGFRFAPFLGAAHTGLE